MHLKELLNRFNVSHFIFYCLLLLLAVLIGLLSDGVISAPYSAMFFPLWIWNVLLVGAVVGGVVRWIKSSREFRRESENIYQFKAMLFSASLQFLIFLTELLTAVNIDTNTMPWLAIFTPLYLLCFVSIPICMWGCYRKRSIEIEILSMTTLLQLIFLGLKLDRVVDWKWAIVFIPIWLLYFCFIISLVVMGVVTILTYVLSENQLTLEERKLPDVLYFIFASLFCFFFIVFLGLLSSRLDNDITIPYSVVFIFFYISLFCLIVLTLCRKPANIWWFGIRKNFMELLLTTIPILQDYANVSYSKVQEQPLKVIIDNHKSKKPQQDQHDLYPYENIYLPD